MTMMNSHFWHRLPHLVSVGALAAVSTIVGVTGALTPASAVSGCGTMTGSGTEADPWQLWTDADLNCVAVGTTWVPAGGGTHGWVEIMDDLVYDSALPILPAAGFTYLHLDGRGHTVSIDGVTESNGLLSATRDADVRNLVIVATNDSTLAIGAGWFSFNDMDSTYTNVGSTGPIPAAGGGIVGAAIGTSIDGAFSSGDMGLDAGGIIGSGSDEASVRHGLATGTIAPRGGGIVGRFSSAVSVTRSFSTGAIGQDAGGIVGGGAANGVVTDSYSTGFIHSYAGGIVGQNAAETVVANSYTLGFVDTGGGPFFGRNDVDSTIANSLAFENNGWSDVGAMATLTGAGTTWLSCAVNEPWAIASFYPDDICSPVRDEVVVAEMAPTSVRRVAPSSGVFSLVNGVGTHPFSWVSIVNDTGSVRMNGVDCTTPTSCIVQGFTQAGAVVARDVTIVSAGLVTVLVHGAGEIGHREVFDLDVAAETDGSPGSGNSGSGNSGSGTGGSGAAVLPLTGRNMSDFVAWMGVMVVLGAGLIVLTRRRASHL